MRLVSYEGPKLDSLCVRENNTILETMKVMNNAGLRLVPVISADDGKFSGVVADGDIRRFLSEGGQLHEVVKQVINRSPILLDHDVPLSDIRALMVRRGIEYFPFVKNDQLKALYVLWIQSVSESQTAVIMVGGQGRRLVPLTENCPKPLLEVGGKPILSHIIEHLRAQGVNRFVLSTNYLAEQIVDYYGNGSSMGVDVSYVNETSRLGTVGALSLVDAESLTEPFLCLNGDILNDIDLDSLRQQHTHNNWDATMVVREFSYTLPYGVVNTGPCENFKSFEEKPSSHFKINAGFYMLSKSVLSAVPKGEFYDLPTLFSEGYQRGMKSGTYMHNGRWIDIGDLDELRRARSIFEGSPS